MDCADCARKVASALEEVPGVVGVQVNYASGKAYLVLEREEALREAEARLAPLGYRLLQAEGEGEGLPGPWPWALLSGGLLLLACPTPSPLWWGSCPWRGRGFWVLGGTPSASRFW